MYIPLSHYNFHAISCFAKSKYARSWNICTAGSHIFGLDLYSAIRLSLSSSVRVKYVDFSSCRLRFLPIVQDSFDPSLWLCLWIARLEITSKIYYWTKIKLPYVTYKRYTITFQKDSKGNNLPIWNGKHLWCICCIMPKAVNKWILHHKKLLSFKIISIISILHGFQYTNNTHVS